METGAPVALKGFVITHTAQKTSSIYFIRHGLSIVIAATGETNQFSDKSQGYIFAFEDRYKLSNDSERCGVILAYNKLSYN